MALIMYLNRAPRYKDTTIKDIMLIESYFAWQHENEIKSQYSCDSFEKWCGTPDNELPDMAIIEYYKQFYTKKDMYTEYIGKTSVYSILEQLARIVKNNQAFNWFIHNVMDNNINEEYYEVSKAQFEELLNTCNKVKDSFELSETGGYPYIVNEDVAKELFPLLEQRGYFFGLDQYNGRYAEQIIELIEIIENILETTDFETQMIYFNASW